MKKYYSKQTNGFYIEESKKDYEKNGNWPSDLVEITQEKYMELTQSGRAIICGDDGILHCAPEYAPTVDDLIAINTQAIQLHLDSFARSRGYDNIISACSYASQPVGAHFQAEGAAFLAWRSAVWAKAYDVVTKVKSGAMTLPTVEESIASMPIFKE